MAKKLGKAHATIRKYVEQGKLRTTKTGEIPEDAIEELLERSLQQMAQNGPVKIRSVFLRSLVAKSSIKMSLKLILLKI